MFLTNRGTDLCKSRVVPGGMSRGKKIGEFAIGFQTVHCLEVKHLDRGNLSFKIL